MPWSMNRMGEGLPLSAFRDVKQKAPSMGPNLDALDGVRGVAVLIVIFAHTHSFGMSKHGGVGVWLFYCLSGFLLTLPFARGSARFSQQGQLRHYFSRRIRRIFPAYYLWLVFWFIVFHGDAEAFFSHALFVRADGHLWSIPQELVFYLVLPLLVMAGYRIFQNQAGYAVVALAGLALLAFSPLGVLLPNLPGGAAGETRFMMGNFLAGMIGAYLVVWLAGNLPSDTNSLVGRVIGILSVVGCLVLLTTSPYFANLIWRPLLPLWMSGVLFGEPGWQYPWLYAVASAVVVAGVVAEPNSVVAKLMAMRLLRVVGILSFSMYLVHGGVLHWFKSAGWPDGLKLVSAVVPLSFLAAVLIYHYVERPFLVRGEVPRRIPAAEAGE